MRTIIQREGRVWAWAVFNGSVQVAGGYCATKRDALNDSTIWLRCAS